MIFIYLFVFALLIILTLSNVKLAQIAVPISILVIVISELTGIISHYYLLILGGLMAYIPASLLIGGLLNVRAVDFGGIMAEYMNIISLMFFYFPIFSFYLLLLVYSKVGNSGKLAMKGYSLALLVFLVSLLTMVAQLDSRAIILFFGMFLLFYISIIALPIPIFFTGLDKISDKRIKRWFYIAFFVLIIGPILFLIVFRNTGIASAEEDERVS